MKRLLSVICAAAVSTVFGDASTNEGGEYTYPSWQTDNRTTGQTGDQTWNVVNPISVGNFFVGQTDIVPYWQIYTGASITGSGKTRLMKGNVVFENSMIWTGTATDANIVGYLGSAKLVLRNGGSLAMNGTDFRIGQKYNDSTESDGAVFMEELLRKYRDHGIFIPGI